MASRPPRRSSRTRIPAAPIATSVSPLRQGRPKVSVTTTPTSHAERVPQPVAHAAGRGVGVLGQQQHGAGRGVGGVDAGRGHHQAVPGLARSGSCPRRATSRTVSASMAASRSSARDEPALGLADDLRGDQEHVAVGQSGAGGGDQLGEVVARLHLADAGHRRRPRSAVRPAPSRPHLLGEGQRLAGHRGGGLDVRHQQRHGPAADAGRLHLRRPSRASTVSTSQPSSSPVP